MNTQIQRTPSQIQPGTDAINQPKLSPIPPGTSLLDILKYLLSGSTGSSVGSKALKGLVAAIMAWWSVDKAKSFRDGASLSDVTKWQTEVSNRLERLEAYAVAPPTQPDPFEFRKQAAIRRQTPIPPPLPVPRTPPK